MSRSQFVEWINDAIVSLPHQLKAMLRVVEDPEIKDDDRVAAAGAVLHVLSASNAIPGMVGMLAYVDDVLVLRLVLERIAANNPEAFAAHREDSPELAGSLEEELSSARAYLGDLIKVLDKAATEVSEIQHMGHSARQCVHDIDSSNWLYDAVQEALVEQLEFDEDEVARELRSVDKIRAALQTRVA